MNHTRRALLVAGAAGLIPLGSRRLAAADDLPEFDFIIVSDTHLGRQEAHAPERNWRRAIAEINELPGAFVLHLGDVVDSGRATQYPLYAEIRKELKKPIHEVPGNHDPHELFTQHIQAKIDRSFVHAGVRFVLFGNAHTDSHLGFITPEQIAWLGEEFSAAAKQDEKIVVCCHVPIHKNLSPDRAWYVKPEDGQTAFYELLDRHAGRVLACLHGHFHNGIRGWRDRQQIVEVLCPSVLYNQDRNFAASIEAGKAQGFSVAEFRPGYVLAKLGRGRLTMHYKPLGEASHGEYQANWS